MNHNSSNKKVKNVFDIHGNQIKLYDVCKNITTDEIVLITEAINECGVHGLSVTNKIAGIDDWLDVYPDGELEILGNAATSYE